MAQSPDREQQGALARHCYWHPEVETGLSCSRCGKDMCTQCLVQAPVGIRCRECGKEVRTPTFDVQPSYYARAVAVGVVIAIGGGLLWILLVRTVFGRIPYLPSLLAIAVGYAAGELISRSVNRKRGLGLSWIAGGSVVVAFLISWLTLRFSFDVFGLLFIILGVFIAVQRVR